MPSWIVYARCCLSFFAPSLFLACSHEGVSTDAQADFSLHQANCLHDVFVAPVFYCLCTERTAPVLYCLCTESTAPVFYCLCTESTAPVFMLCMRTHQTNKHNHGLLRGGCGGGEPKKLQIRTDKRKGALKEILRG
jgi:hypothetical protein